jgi:RHS repeat-associated protein
VSKPCPNRGSSAITDGSGALVVLESFAAYGARRGSNWTGPPSAPDLTAIANATRQGFTGHEMLDNLGLIHMNGRVYDPAIGRFLSADPFMDFGTGGQAINRYAYVGNNPLAFTDPTGFDADGSNPWDCGRFTVESTASGFTVTDTLAGQLTSHDAWHSCFPRLFPYASGRSEFTPSYVGAGVPTLESLNPTPDYEDGTVGGTGAVGLQRAISARFTGALSDAQKQALDAFFAPYGGYDGFLSAVDCIPNCGMPGNGTLEANLAGLPIIGAPISVARGGVAAVRVGRLGEAAVRAVVNIGPATRITVNGVNRIPDGLTARVLSEVKNVGSLSYTRQLRDFAAFAQQTGRQFDLYVRPNTQLSGPLLDAINAGYINLRYIPGL